MSVLKILWYKEAMDISYEPSAKALLEKYQSKVLTEQTKNDQGPRKVTTKNGDILLDGTIKKKKRTIWLIVVLRSKERKLD